MKSDITPYVALNEARRGSARLWPDGVTLDTFHAADSIQEAVTEKAIAQGTNAYFGDTSALAALHGLAVFVCRLPRAQRERVLLWIGGKDDAIRQKG